MQSEVYGNFDLALEVLLGNLTEGKKTNRQMLAEWDSLRGNDYHTATKRGENKWKKGMQC